MSAMKKHYLSYLLFGFCFPLMASQEAAQKIYQHWLKKESIPLLSQMHKQPAMVDAYKTQFHYVKLRLEQDQIAGFKAGLTSAAGQKKFKVDSALAGVLFNRGNKKSVQPLKLQQFGKLMLETELGFRLKQPIEKPLQTVEQAKQLVATVAAVIELPDLGFAKGPLTGADIVAANVASNAFIMGPEKKLAELPDVNSLQVILARDKQVINK